VSVDLRINLKKLEVLDLVVQHGGVGRAAEHLLVAQPVVTAHIRSLEQRLGAKLFYREGRQLELTEAGLAVHEWANEVLTRTRELERHLDGLSAGREGTVVLGASMSVGSYRLPHILTSFRAANPAAKLRVSISDTEHAIEDTRAGALDFAVVVSDALREIPGMDFEQLGEDRIVLVAAPDGEPSASTISAGELSRLTFIEVPGGIVRRSVVERQLRRLGVKDRNVVLELGHPEAMKRAVREGVGVAMLFRSAVHEELEHGILREIAVDGLDVVFPIYVVYRKGKSFSPLHRELLDHIRAALPRLEAKAAGHAEQGADPPG
jgi:DNA-binding transcriptional LysR family regulator